MKYTMNKEGQLLHELQTTLMWSKIWVLPQISTCHDDILNFIASAGEEHGSCATIYVGDGFEEDAFLRCEKFAKFESGHNLRSDRTFQHFRRGSVGILHRPMDRKESPDIHRFPVSRRRFRSVQWNQISHQGSGQD